MSEQRTSAEREVDETTKEPIESARAESPSGTRESAQSESPTGTRELRDAQRRPPIRAEDGSPAARTPARGARLFDESAGQELRRRWQEIQTGFVDEPRQAVEKADALVAQVLTQLTETFAKEREQLEASWSSSEGREGDANTEDLRQAIQRYRAFFDRLLSF